MLKQVLKYSSATTTLVKTFNFSNKTKIGLHTSALVFKMDVDKKDLKSKLSPLQYQVTQEAATERPFSGCYNKFYEPGTYTCVVCEQPLFNSDTKYDSGCGWPAFNDVLDQGRVKLTPDTSGVGGNLLLLISQPGRIRTEVTCSKCKAHLGHVFDDGPPPTRKRFCINSASMNFIPNEKAAGDS